MQHGVVQNVAIVGGGIAGSALAIALSRRGIKTTLIEREATWAPASSGIFIYSNGLQALDRLGVLDDICASGWVSPDGDNLYLTASGETITNTVYPGIGERIPAIVGIRRLELHRVLANAVEALGVNIRLGVTVVAIQDGDSANPVSITLSDGTILTCDVLVGADGIRSRVRAQMFGDGDPNYIGWVAHRTTIPIEQVPEEVDRNIVALWGGEGFHIVHYPLRHGKLFNIVTVFRTPTYAQKVDMAGYKAEIDKTYARAHPVMKKLIEMTALDWRGAVADREPIRHWTKGRAVLLGDAAHSTLQSLAQGACMAIEDGVVLAELIATSRGNYEAAFAQFQAERVTRTARVIFESRYMWEVLHPEGDTREPVHRRFRAMSRDQVWDEMAWLYDGAKVPAFKPR